MTIRVSNSEALALSCEARWMWAFHHDFKLEPKTQSIALTRGTIGHQALEIFFRGILEEIKREDAEAGAINFLISTLTEASKKGDYVSLEAATQLMPIIKEYFTSWTLKKFLSEVDILGVEQRFDVELPGGFIIPGQADMVVRYKEGQYKGETAPIDNKFVYNHWSEDDFRMNSQIPTYIYGLRNLYPKAVIRRGIINQLRHRSNAVERFVMTPITPERGEINSVIENHIKQASRIAELQKLSGEEIQQSAIKTLSKYTCGNCGFRSLCKSELIGGNTHNLIKIDYRANSYGYGGDDSE